MHPASRVQSDSKGAVDGTSPPRGPVFVHRLVRVWSFSTGCGSCGARTRVGGQCGWMRRSEEHTSELQSLMRISYAVFSLKKHKIILLLNFLLLSTRNI